MTNTIYAIKKGMSECYLDGIRKSVTILEVLPMTVIHQKTVEKDGYASTQVIFGETTKKATKSLAGHLKQSKAKGKYIREIDGATDLAVGSLVNIDALLVAGTVVDVSGISKGKGIAGVVKRWNFAGGPRTHGQSDRLRRAGSIGQGTTPGRVYKGKKMSGRMGNAAVTIKNSTIIAYKPDSKQLFIAGSVPGSFGNLVKLVKRADAPSSFPTVTLTKQHKIVESQTSAPVESETV
ncbi:MAG: 50S ribosomal protein L3 [Candidatus Microgenomates bacterium]